MEPESPAKKRGSSRRLYVLWGVALGLLLTLGIFCWFLLFPYLQVRAAVKRYRSDPGLIAEEIQRLGGQEKAFHKLSFYRSLPDQIAPAWMVSQSFL